MRGVDKPSRRDEQALSPGWRERDRADRLNDDRPPPAAPTAAPPAAPPRRRARMALVGIAFVAGMAIIVGRFAELAESRVEEPDAPAALSESARPTDAARRAEILDRNGATLAASVRTYEVYFNPADVAHAQDAREAAEALAELFPARDVDELRAAFSPENQRAFRVALQVPPATAQATHNLGLPGVFFEERWDRVYLAGALTAHAVGWTDIDGVGAAGLERSFDAELAPSEDGGARPPLRTALDLRAQLRVHAAMSEELTRTGANYGAAVVMDARTGEVRAMVSLPDFDPHRRPDWPADAAAATASPLFNHAAQGRYEPGSALKVITWALALETGVADMASAFDPQPLRIGGHDIEDYDEYGPMSFPVAFAKSSNIVAAELALAAGAERQSRLFAALGLQEATTLEVPEAAGRAPIWEAPWSDTTTAVTSYGHAVQMTLTHLAAATASIVNGGRRVRPTLLPRPATEAPGEQVVSAETSYRMREIMRLAVADGTGRAADVPGLEVGGKTGTADKYGGEEGVRATFVAAFPIYDPQYVVAVMFDEPEVVENGVARRVASRTVAPVVARIIRETAPILGVVAAAE